ncbi:thioredoxin domain containing protein [Metallosphaera yellowstonensis MK1]|uniref:Thioredoxin domain containing protein n=1 Tax=Metallosphaera yellowstonensis MK1 TaxID=671065 RepID=H2C1E0_9CREN|nr:thioredoxin domain-containing protein [Metallosphaera yellowstonensis]EHP70061.1 thioredoxin domain containing protein [Metallosphaera yellowstonensis MK1]
MEFKEWSDSISDGNPLKVIYFWTEWCEECEAQARELSLVENWPGFSYVSVNADERPDLAVRYSPQIYPSLSIVTENSVVGGTYGFVSQEQVRETLLLALNLLLGGGKLVVPKSTKREGVDSTPTSPKVLVERIKRNCLSFFDIYYGGFEKEPKYYLPNVLRFLMRIKGDPYPIEVVRYTLDAVIYNLWDDGFYSHSRTYDWKERSRTKLTDQNAEMILTLLDAYGTTNDSYYLDYAVETGRWLMGTRVGEFYPVAMVDGRARGPPLMTVNSLVGEALLQLHSFTGDPKFLNESLRLASLLKRRLSHDLRNEGPLFLLDLAYLLRFLSALNQGRELVNLALSQYFGGDAFYDVTLEHAKVNGIGRFKLITDNSILGQGLVRLGMRELANGVVDYFSRRYWNFAYFNQADLGLLVEMLHGDA